LATEFYALLNSLASISYNDQENSIEEYITYYQHSWNNVVGIIIRADLVAGNHDRFGEGLQKFARNDKAKAKFQLKLLLPFYANMDENIRAKDYSNDNAVRKLKEYFLMGQKSKEPKTNE
jgi:hypothetical protein